jgi:hypothetical protein
MKSGAKSSEEATASLANGKRYIIDLSFYKSIIDVK